MKTALHTRNKNRRDLFRAVPVNRTAELEKKEKKEWEELKELIAKGHKHFWQKRTQGKPPKVSKTRFNCFDILD
jgi:hypothetical protein